MAGVTFSKLSGLNEDRYKAVEGLQTEIIADEEKQLNKHDAVLQACCAMKTSKKFGERAGGMTSLGNMKPMGEGATFAKEEMQSDFAVLAVHKAFGMAFTTTHEMIEDSMFDEAAMAARNFVDSYKRSRLQFLTNAFDTSASAASDSARKTFAYEGESFNFMSGDAEAFFSTGHKYKTKSGTQSNVYTNAFGTNATMLNRLAVLGRGFKNSSGIPIGLTFDTIVIPSNCYAMEDTIKKIIASEQVVGSDFNDVNTQKGKWTLVIDHLWEAASGTNPYILMSSEAQKRFGALRWYDREKLDVRNHIDEDTRNLEWTGYCRQSIMPYMWQGFILGGATSGTTLS